VKPSPTENDAGWTKNEEQLTIDQAPTLGSLSSSASFLCGKTKRDFRRAMAWKRLKSNA
jgi:hypothetical protein